VIAHGRRRNWGSLQRNQGRRGLAEAEKTTWKPIEIRSSVINFVMACVLEILKYAGNA